MIPIKTPEEIRIMTKGGKILARIVRELGKRAKPGRTTQELEELAERLILESGGQCSFKGYDGFPACLCASVNQVIVHAPPSTRKLEEGDIVSLDLGLLYKGFHTDMARTFGVGRVSPAAQKLMRVTRQALDVALQEVRPGKHFGDVEWATQDYVESQGFNVVRQLCGHGIGRELHEDPQILNYGKKGTGPELVEGMVFCIEPMVTAKDWKLKLSPDGFGYETVDGSLCCHFEDMVLVTPNGHQILTK
ncbi:MAG: type I methionyl aminopeptidase [Candidatus Nealsonbacteria bacterium]|nr:type I methionyl aminopeptidase [Candidatus Nealsonbacteria bacterium]